jgi:hypothetical protein
MNKLVLFSLLTAGFSFSQIPGGTTATPSLKNSDKLKEYPSYIQSKNTADFIPGFREYYFFDGVNYDLNSRNEYTYVNSNKLEEDLGLIWTGTEFVNQMRISNEYTAAFDRSLFESWDDMAEEWMPSWLDSTYYDANFNVIGNVSFNYNVSLQAWEKQWANSQVITYDASNRIIEIEYFYLNYDGDMVLEEKEVWDWTGAINGPTSAQFYNWNEIAQEWELSMRALALEWFDFSNFLIAQAEIEFWDDVNEFWEKAFRLEASYFGNGTVEEFIEQDWDGTQYENVWKETNTIDANMVKTLSIYYYWNEIDMEWEVDYGVEYTNSYGPNDQLLQQDMAYYNSGTGSYDPMDRYVYGDHINVANLTEQKLIRSLFPNPASETLHVNIGEENGVGVVMDLTGKRIGEYSLSGAHTSINLNELKAGTYMLVILTDNGSSVHRFIKN